MAHDATSSLALPIATSTTQSVPLPASVPKWTGKPSLCNVPTELRLEICNYLLGANNIPRSYGYTGPRVSCANNTDFIKPPPCQPHRHAMLFVSQQFSAEYRQCYYERTTFFLRVDRSNAFRAIPALNRYGNRVCAADAVPDFWSAPDALLRSLRNCTLYVELGEIASNVTSLHSISLNKRKAREQLLGYGSLAEIRAQDSLFDSAFRSSILNLLPHMQQLRSVYLVWDTSKDGTTRAWDDSTDWTWESLGEPFVEYLKQKVTIRAISVKVGDRFGYALWTGKREDGVWKGDLVRWDLQSRSI